MNDVPGVSSGAQECHNARAAAMNSAASTVSASRSRPNPSARQRGSSRIRSAHPEAAALEVHVVELVAVDESA
ncbi:hypothetical protein [Streptomyces coffeae]|uniref:Uncharacterized protein n=1 Tax=Streptomyces coffeae TaxID=621382 RepID=A0ABS1NIV2_9ACTN|nr:hypothetical protein [Streptomyces coffeae]MBL1099820.1 hypothetical protein [Streptomyces coffeae]